MKKMIELDLSSCTLEELKENFYSMMNLRCNYIYICLESSFTATPKMYLLTDKEREKAIEENKIYTIYDYKFINRIYNTKEDYCSINNVLESIYKKINKLKNERN